MAETGRRRGRQQHEAGEGQQVAFTTQPAVGVKPSSRRIEGRATFTMDASKIT